MAITQNSTPPGWILVAGLLLFAFGLEARSQDDFDGPIGGATQAVPFGSSYGTADSNGSMIAVTGPSLTGGSLLYLVDTQTRRLSVYQARGGAKSTMGIEWIGARNIDLDLRVNGWNDRSELPYSELVAEFQGGQIPQKTKK